MFSEYVMVGTMPMPVSDIGERVQPTMVVPIECPAFCYAGLPKDETTYNMKCFYSTYFESS